MAKKQPAKEAPILGLAVPLREGATVCQTCLNAPKDCVCIGRKKSKFGPPAVAQDKLSAVGTEAICELIMAGTSYRTIIAMFDVSMGTLVNWIEADLERSRACTRAREASAQSYDEMALDELDKAADGFALMKAKEKAAHYRWRAKAVNPRRYGEKVAVGGADDLPPIRQSLDLSALSGAELVQMEQLLGKAVP